MKPNEARKLLGLPPVENGIVTPQQVRVAFHRQVRAAHPDTGADPAQSSDTVEKLGQAKRVLLDAIDNECPQCGGEGYVATKGKFATSRVCMKCDGRGELP